MASDKLTRMLETNLHKMSAHSADYTKHFFSLHRLRWYLIAWSKQMHMRELGCIFLRVRRHWRPPPYGCVACFSVRTAPRVYRFPTFHLRTSWMPCKDVKCIQTSAFRICFGFCYRSRTTHHTKLFAQCGLTCNNNNNNNEFTMKKEKRTEEKRLYHLEFVILRASLPFSIMTI